MLINLSQSTHHLDLLLPGDMFFLNYIYEGDHKVEPTKANIKEFNDNNQQAGDGLEVNSCKPLNLQAYNSGFKKELYSSQEIVSL